MSYPPPPGAPQDPPQQSGYSPPPAVAPSPPPRGVGPGHQPDPYAAPPGDPYALPAPGAPGPPAPPRPPQQPAGPPPPRPKSKRGWIVGAGAAVVVVAAAAVGIVLVGGGDARGVIEAGQTEEGADEDVGIAEPSGGEYGLGPDFCEVLNYSVVEEALDVDTPQGGLVAADQVYCTSPDDTDGRASVRAWQSDDGEAAVAMFESLSDEGALRHPEKITGDWDNGEIGLRDSGGGLMAQKGNLVIVVELYPPMGDQIEVEPATDAVVALASNVFEVTEL